MKEEKKITIKEVANKAGVSQTSVSLVLNNRKNNLSNKTRERIIKVAKELKYEPNHIARSLATNKTYTIGVIIPDITNVFFAESVRNIQKELSKYKYDMILANSEEKFINDINHIKLFVNRKLDGLILTMSSESMEEENQSKIHKLLNESKIPYLLFDRYFNGEDSKVYVDNYKGGFDVGSFLLEKGHKEIGIITGPMSLNSSKERYLGLKDALKSKNISLNPNNIYYGKYDYASGIEGAKKLIKNNVSAIFAFNDMQAYGVIEIAKELKIRIPEDLSLVGFDDSFYSSILETKLTSVKQPIESMSKKAGELIVELIEKQIKEPQNFPFEATLIKRDSVKKIN